MSMKTSCFACDSKDILGIFKCEGCLQKFCLKHANEHRDYLQYQLDEIILEHVKFNKTTDRNKDESSSLIEQINQWEKNSIEKIQQIAQDTRIQLQQFAEIEKKQFQEKSSQLKNQLLYARMHDEYLEDDLAQWKILLEQLIYDFEQLSPYITIEEHQNESIIPRLVISKINQDSTINDSLISDSNHIRFDDQHYLAMHCANYRIPIYISGTQEYATGQHQIRFFIRKKSSAFTMSFNIMSKLMDLSSTSDFSQYLTYGWQTDDCINPSQSFSSTEKIPMDLKGKTKFHIKFLIDCDNQTIAYVNEKTKRKREIHVDLNKCPLPWKLHFYLYDIGDTVRLLSASAIA